jgi:hypothetical protein
VNGILDSGGERYDIRMVWMEPQEHSEQFDTDYAVLFQGIIVLMAFQRLIADTLYRVFNQ